MNRVRAVVGAVLVALLIPACRSHQAPIRIGAVYPLSGSQGPGGVDEFNGVRLAVDMVNQDGGIAGRLVKLVPVDTAAADAGPAAVDQLASQGVDLVFGSYGSTISQSTGSEAVRRGMLFWETGAVGSMPGPGPGRSFFRVAPSGAVLGRTAISFIAHDLSPLIGTPSADLRFAVANVTDPYGTEVARGAVDEVRRLGIGLAGQYPYDPRRPDFPDMVRSIAASGANVLFVVAYLQDGIDMRREIVRQGLHLLAGIGTSSSYCMPAFGATLGREAVGLFASDKPDAEYLDPAGLLPEARAVLSRASSAYEARYGREMDAPALAGFAAGWALLQHVLPRASSLTPSGVADAALSADVPQGGLPNGSGLRFGHAGTSEAGENLQATSVIWEWVGVGRRAVVWPPRFATQPVQAIHPMP